MIFRTELYKICSKKLVFIGLAGSLLFLAFYFWVSTIGSEYIYVDGQLQVRLEAIRTDREIAARYTGTLDSALADEILEKYGWVKDADNMGSPLAGETVSPSYQENYCNRFVTNELSSRRRGGEEPYHLLKEDTMIAAMMDGELQFGYGECWGSGFREMHMMVLIVISILSIVAAAPIFSEEYGLGTAPVLLTTVHGKGKAVFYKALAALAFGSFLYLLATGLTFGAYALVYGTEGLKTSAALFLPDLYFMPGTYQGSLGSYLFRYLFVGLLSIWASIGITLYLSSKCRQSFTALIWSLIAYLSPYVLYIVAASIPKVTRGIMYLIRFIQCLPAFVPYSELTHAPAFYRCRGYLITGAIIIAGTFCGGVRYRHYQDR